MIMMKRLAWLLSGAIGLLLAVTVSEGLAARALNGAPYTMYLPLIQRPYEPEWIGPDGGSIVCLAISATNPNIMYAGTWGAGVHKTTDGGATWTQVNTGLPNLQINAIAVDPKDANVVYAGPYRYQLYKSLNGGANWSAASAGIQAQAIVYSIAIDPVQTNNVYIATRGQSVEINPDRTNWNGRVYRTTNGGATWLESLVNVGGPTFQDWAYSLAVHPTTPNIVYAAVHQHGAYRSTNYGVSWSPVNTGIYLEDAEGMISGRSILFNPLNTEMLFFGVWHGSAVYITDNGARSWARYNEGPNGTITPAIYNMALNPSNPLNVYLATWNYYGVLKSTASSYTWQPAGLEQNRIYTVGVNPQTPSTVFAGTLGDGLYRSTNSATSWSQRQNGITNTSVKSLVALPSGSIYSAITNGGVSRLLSAGQSWQAFNAGLPEKAIHDLVSSPGNPNLLFAATNSSGLYFVDVGVSNQWSRVDLNIDATDVAAQIYAPDHPFATREDLEAEANPLPQFDLRASIAGEASMPAMKMTFSPSNPNVAYLGVFAGGTSNRAIYRSFDGGFTWESAGLTGLNVWDVAIHPQNPRIIYAASNSPGTIFISEDYGFTWRETYLPVTYTFSVATSVFDPNRVYVGTNDGVYMGLYNGNLTRLGLAGISITVLETDLTRPGYLYAGTNRGVYVSFDGGITWTNSLPALPNDTIQSISFDTIDPRYVYFGTLTRGAVKYLFP
jgi:photosystem II stability/assembly factor-like uncharacterized protein